MKNNRRFPTLAITFVLLLSLFSPAASAVSTANANLTPTSNSEKIADIMEAGEQYMGADIEETGISACITKEGRLQVTCELLVPTIYSSANSGDEIKRYAISTLLMVDQNGDEIIYPREPVEESGAYQGVLAVHTTYFDYRTNSAFSEGWTRVNSMETYFEYDSWLGATSFYHLYETRLLPPDAYDVYEEIDFPEEGVVYSDEIDDFYDRDDNPDDGIRWHPVDGVGTLSTAAVVNVSGHEFTVRNSRYL